MVAKGYRPWLNSRHHSGSVLITPYFESDANAGPFIRVEFRLFYNANDNVVAVLLCSAVEGRRYSLMYGKRHNDVSAYIHALYVSYWDDGGPWCR